MCPECFANIALLVTGAVSAGGVTVAALKLLGDRKTAGKLSAIRKNLGVAKKSKEHPQ